MTALDPSPIVRELRDEKRYLGQYRPETVERLIAATERTCEIPVVPASSLLAFPRGGRHAWQIARPPVPAPRPAELFRGSCGAQRPSQPGVAPVLCTEAPGHDEGPDATDHVARGAGDRVIARWPILDLV